MNRGTDERTKDSSRERLKKAIGRRRRVHRPTVVVRLGQRIDAQRVLDEGRRHARTRRGADAAVDQVPVGRHVRLEE